MPQSHCFDNARIVERVETGASQSLLQRGFGSSTPSTVGRIEWHWSHRRSLHRQSSFDGSAAQMSIKRLIAQAFCSFTTKQRLATLAAIWVVRIAAMQLTAAPGPAKAAPLEIVLVEAGSVTAEMVSKWKKEGVDAVAVVLEERRSKSAYGQLARRVSGGGLDLYLWIEV